MPRYYVFVPLLLSLLVAACSEPPTHKEIIRTVISYEPNASSSQSQRTLAGVLQAVDQSTLSFEIPGVIDKVNVNLGESFEEGQVLASIDAKVFQLAVKQAQAQLSEAQARLNEARLDYERKKQLVGTGAVSQAVVDLAQSRFKSLVDQVDIANTQLAIAQEDLSDTQLKAPYSGSVAQRHVEPSQQIAPSAPIFTIQGSDALEVSVLAPESMIAGISKGDSVKVDIVVKQQRQSLIGEVFEKGKQAQRANAFPVTIALKSEEMPIQAQAGMSAEVSFTLDNNNMNDGSMRAPLSAIAAAANDKHYVYQIVKDSNEARLKRVPIEVVSMHSDHVRFTSDIPLDSIVRVGLDFLEDGQKVHLREQSPKTMNQ